MPFQSFSSPERRLITLAELPKDKRHLKSLWQPGTPQVINTLFYLTDANVELSKSSKRESQTTDQERHTEKVHILTDSTDSYNYNINTQYRLEQQKVHLETHQFPQCILRKARLQSHPHQYGTHALAASAHNRSGFCPCRLKN